MKKDKQVPQTNQEKLIVCPKCKGGTLDLTNNCPACAGTGKLLVKKITKKIQHAGRFNWN